MNLSEPPSIEPFEWATTAGIADPGTIIALVVLGILLMASGLISGSEAAFFSLSPTDKEEMKDNKEKRTFFVNYLIERPKDLLATILVINNFVNVAIVILSSFLLNDIYPPSDGNEALHFFIEVVLITLIILLFGEVIPKIYATKNAPSFSILMGRPLYYVNRIPPVSWISNGLVKGTGFIQRIGGRGKVKISSDELEHALALTREENDTDEDHKILEGIVRFGNTEVSQIMKSRVDVYAIEESSEMKEVMKMILDCGHSRIPVYRDTFDNIVGVLFIKDLLPHIHDETFTDWLTLIRKPFFVTENKKIDDLLKEFQDKKIHIAMVVDEYGGTSGIVTLEDVLEEIVGDITDEFDDDEIVYTKINDNSYLFEGRTALVDFYKVLNIEEKDLEADSHNADTIGGFIIENAGRILMNNEFIEAGRYKFIVESSDKRRIKMVKVIIKPEETATENE
ncbi:MAG: gliding motility-associated protein GldE [Crocinitomicaceae bacterium]